jgi:6-phosphofructokinase 2
MRILCIALNPTIDVSADVARVKPTHKMRSHNQRQEAGGGGVNVARVIAELGGNPELLIISGGAAGTLLEESLRQMPLSLQVVRTTEQTRIAFIAHEEETNLEYRFVPEGPLVSTADIDRAMAVVEAFAGDYVIASGSLPRGAPDDTYARMAEAAARNGAKFVLDTSAEPLKQALAHGGIFLVKPSIGELETAVGRTLTHETVGDAAMALVESGRVRHVAVTLGADGALLASADGLVRLPAADVPVRSAVGAGDAFVGALIWSLSQGKPVADAFRFGVAAGAAAVMTSGAELCRKQDVHAIYAQLAPVGESTP